MAYTKKTWVDYPSTATMVTAFDLNHIEDGISTADANATQALNNMPTVTDTYDATSSDGMSGIAVASAISGLDTDVTVDAIQTTGTHIADITVDGTKTELYAPEGGSDVDIVTSWETSPSDAKVPSEKLVKESLDALNDDIDAKQDKLTNPLTQSDVVDNLTSTSTVLPLSANQGKALKDSLDALGTSVILYQHTGAVSAQNITVTNLSKFRTITVCIVGGSDAIISSTTIAYDILSTFKTSGYNYAMYDSNNGSFMKYIDDTTLNIKHTGSLSMLIYATY